MRSCVVEAWLPYLSIPSDSDTARTPAHNPLR